MTEQAELDNHAVSRARTKIYQLLDQIRTSDRSAIDRLSTLRMIQTALTVETIDTVQDAVDQGATWQQIGKSLGVTRQAAHSRYGYIRPRNERQDQ